MWEMVLFLASYGGTCHRTRAFLLFALIMVNNGIMHVPGTA
jgi:hypothetical protein